MVGEEAHRAPVEARGRWGRTTRAVEGVSRGSSACGSNGLPTTSRLTCAVRDPRHRRASPAAASASCRGHHRSARAAWPDASCLDCADLAVAAGARALGRLDRLRAGGPARRGARPRLHGGRETPCSAPAARLPRLWPSQKPAGGGRAGYRHRRRVPGARRRRARARAPPLGRNPTAPLATPRVVGAPRACCSRICTPTPGPHVERRRRAPPRPLRAQRARRSSSPPRAWTSSSRASDGVAGALLGPLRLLLPRPPPPRARRSAFSWEAPRPDGGRRGAPSRRRARPASVVGEWVEAVPTRAGAVAAAFAIGAVFLEATGRDAARASARDGGRRVRLRLRRRADLDYCGAARPHRPRRWRSPSRWACGASLRKAQLAVGAIAASWLVLSAPAHPRGITAPVLGLLGTSGGAAWASHSRRPACCFAGVSENTPSTLMLQLCRPPVGGLPRVRRLGGSHGIQLSLLATLLRVRAAARVVGRRAHGAPGGRRRGGAHRRGRAPPHDLGLRDPDHRREPGRGALRGHALSGGASSW